MLNVEARKLPITDVPDAADLATFEKVFIPTLDIEQVENPDEADTLIDIEISVDINSRVYYMVHNQELNGIKTFSNPVEFKRLVEEDDFAFTTSRRGVNLVEVGTPFSIPDIQGLFTEAGSELIPHELFLVAENTYDDLQLSVTKIEFIPSEEVI